MRFAIRDDDTCYFTQPSEIEQAYDFIDDEDIISLSIVPSTVPDHKKDNKPYGEHAFKEYSIEENNCLIEYLRDGIAKGRFDPLLHGYSHEYKCVNNKWLSEMEWKSETRLIDEITEGKKRLEETLGTTISVFVPPSNHIEKKGIKALEVNGLDLSGIIQFNDRKVSMQYFLNFVKRWGIRLIKGIQYGGVLNYVNHKELCAYATDSTERLVKEYNYCKKNNYPFVIYTHYWSINKSQREKNIVKFIYNYAKSDGAKMVGLSELYRK